MKAIIFEKINISLPRQEIYKRLGYREGKTVILSKQKKEIERYIQDAQKFINLKGVGLSIPIKKIEADKVVLSRGIKFKSKNLSILFKECSEVLLMAATAGSNIMKTIKKDLLGKNITRAVVFDAVASETTDVALDWIINYFNQQLRRENKYLLHKRFSAGYGDFLLENQKMIYNILKLRRIGIEITKDFILVPEKSVTAIAGIKDKF